jgi:hypothetical protein
MEYGSSPQWLRVWITGMNGKSDVTLKPGKTCHVLAKQVHFGKTGRERLTFLSIPVQETWTPKRSVKAEEWSKHGL